MGRQVDVVQKFIRIQSFGHNRRQASGIRVEYFPRIHHIAALQQSSIVPVEYEHRARRLHRTDHLHVDCSTTSHGDLKTIKKNANKVLSSFLSMHEDFHQEDGHSSDLDQKRSGILLMIADHKENGPESPN